MSTGKQCFTGYTTAQAQRANNHKTLRVRRLTLSRAGFWRGLTWLGSNQNCLIVYLDSMSPTATQY
jgi:hypothetical protein